MIPALLNPRTVFRVLDDIDRQAPSHTAERSEGSRKALVILASVAFALLVLDYMKNSVAFDGTFRLLATAQGLAPHYWLDKINHSLFGALIHYAWWSSWTVICYVAIPSVVIKLILREKIVDYGWRWNDTHKHWFGYAYLLCPILVFVVIVSHRADFVDHYPFYKLAGRSWLDFLFWEILYLAQFLSLEFFFRGYIVQSLRPHFGAASIWIMVVPYVMIHFTKPWLEATGAIFFGLFLGILALRSRSIWGGFCVHAGVAVSMDIASLITQGKVPGSWLPW